MSAKPIPDGYHSITPYLMVQGVPELLDYLTRALDAKVVFRQDRADGSVAHAEVRIGDSAIMIGEAAGEYGPMPTHLYHYVGDCDVVYQQAIDAGGISIMPVTTMHFSGQRYGGVKDPSGNIWWIATHLEDVPADRQAERFEEWQRERA